MFSGKDKVYSLILNVEGEVAYIDDDGTIWVKFVNKEKLQPSIPDDLELLEKTTNEKELEKTRQRHLKSDKFSIDCDYNRIFSEKRISLSRFVNKLNEYRNSWTKELKFWWVCKLLIEYGYLTENEYKEKVPTKKGEDVGIIRRKYYKDQTNYGYANFYELTAQRMLFKLILDNQ